MLQSTPLTTQWWQQRSSFSTQRETWQQIRAPVTVAQELAANLPVQQTGDSRQKQFYHLRFGKFLSHMIRALATRRLKECTELPQSTRPSIRLSPQRTCTKTTCLSVHLSQSSAVPQSLYLFVVFHLKCSCLSFSAVKCKVTDRKREYFWWKSTKIKNRLTITHTHTFAHFTDLFSLAESAHYGHWLSILIRSVSNWLAFDLRVLIRDGGGRYSVSGHTAQSPARWGSNKHPGVKLCLETGSIQVQFR